MSINFKINKLQKKYWCISISQRNMHASPNVLNNVLGIQIFPSMLWQERSDYKFSPWETKTWSKSYGGTNTAGKSGLSIMLHGHCDIIIWLEKEVKSIHISQSNLWWIWNRMRYFKSWPEYEISFVYFLHLLYGFLR